MLSPVDMLHYVADVCGDWENANLPKDSSPAGQPGTLKKNIMNFREFPQGGPVAVVFATATVFLLFCSDRLVWGP